MISPSDPSTRLQGASADTGFHAFYGIPLVLVGIVLLAKSWRYVPANLQAPLDELAMFFGGWILVVGGLLAAFGSHTWVLDSHRQVFERTWKFGSGLWRRVEAFDQIRSVRFSRQVAHGGAHESFKVDMCLVRGGMFRVGSCIAVGEALELSSQLCQILEKPWEDTTSGVSQWRSFDRVMESVWDSLGKDGEVIKIAEPEPVHFRIPWTADAETSGFTDLVLANQTLFAKGAGVQGVDGIAIAAAEILSVTCGDRLVILSRQGLLECGAGLGATALANFREQILAALLLQR